MSASGLQNCLARFGDCINTSSAVIDYQDSRLRRIQCFLSV